MPTHARLELSRWLQEFPLAKLRTPEREIDVDQIDGPRDIAVLEQLRAEGDIRLRGEGVPTDVCLWNVGEPADRAATKIGGAPYRPTSDPWPTTRGGSPMGLLAQFNFTDSIDVLAPIKASDLPGDVLLIFTSGPHLYGDWDPDDKESWALEWHRVGPHVGEQPARHVHDLTPTFATLHRTMDYPDSQVDDCANVVWGSKFGGIPPYQQGDPELPGVPLCTLASLNPYGGPWPLLNVPVNPKGDDYLDRKLLMIGDLGSVYINLDKSGRVHWSADCG